MFIKYSSLWKLKISQFCRMKLLSMQYGLFTKYTINQSKSVEIGFLSKIFSTQLFWSRIPLRTYRLPLLGGTMTYFSTSSPLNTKSSWRAETRTSKYISSFLLRNRTWSLSTGWLEGQKSGNDLIDISELWRG